MTLLIMAAGMGSRFGGLKQVEPVGPSGEYIIDYSIYDAVKAGFDKVVFIIKKENYELFRDTVGKRVEKFVNVSYVFQDYSNIIGYNVPEDRIKPFGTGHAVLCAKDEIKDNFAVITADDFYGNGAFNLLAQFLKNVKKDEKNYVAISYDVEKTINSSGSVKRGLCKSKNGYITNIIESKIEYVDGTLMAYPLSGSKSFEITSDINATMAIFGFTPEIFKQLDSDFKLFLEKNKNDLSSCEFLLTDSLDNAINSSSTMKEIKTNDSWYGMTYKEDKDDIKKHINNLIKDGVYPNILY